MKQIVFLVVLVVIAFSLSGCAAPNPLEDKAPPTESPAGFLLGLLHGGIAVFVFIFSLFGADANIYEAYNNGGWYNFGFLLGTGAISFGIRRAS